MDDHDFDLLMAEAATPAAVIIASDLDFECFALPPMIEPDLSEAVENGLATMDGLEGQSVEQVADTESDRSDELHNATEIEIGALPSDDGLPTWDVCPSLRMEVAVPGMPSDLASEYHEVYSSIVESVIESSSYGRRPFKVEFTDGQEDMLSLNELLRSENGKKSLHKFFDIRERGGMSRKRKASSEDEWDSALDDLASDLMDLDDEDDEDDDQDDQDDQDQEMDEDDDDIQTRRRKTPAPQGRLLRSRENSRRRSLSRIPAASDDDDTISHEPSRPTRDLRERKPQQLKLTEMTFNSPSRQPHLERDELSLDVEQASDGDDDTFLPVISDLGMKKPKKKMKLRSKRMQTQRLRPQRQTKTGGKSNEDSDIEFEQPRRSSRATKNTLSMRDDSFMDDESFYLVDDKSPPVAKVVSIKEVFSTMPAESSFGSVHMPNCHTCGGSRQRGQILYCQGCSLSFHKTCIGHRSGREHQATKVSEDEFVLQCRFCIGLIAKRDANAPAYGMCQECKEHGKACAAFSEKQTARQEEKIREQNNGVDPVTTVSPELINHANIVLFRCTTCHRAWHQDHLPSISGGSVGTDLKEERLKAYSSDWRCHECSSAKNKVHRLIAWRPVEEAEAHQAERTAFEDVDEDSKEYLIKWENRSYAHCTWKPAAWVYGAVSSKIRIAFGKRAVENDLLKLDEKEVVPDEHLMPDIIFNVKMEGSFPKGKSKQADLASISKVSKIFVKFQGLGYDDVVWDKPPTEHNPDLYNSFVEAYRNYIAGKYFQSESYSKIRERVRVYKNEPFEELETQPAGLKRGKLMGYQIEGLNWLLQNYHHGKNVVLADEMGLGKTVQVIGLVTSLVQDGPRCWPFLIVVPNSTCPNWRREFKQWVPDLRVVTYHGGKEPQEITYKYELFPDGSTEMKAHVVIMSYDSAQDPRTRALFNTVHWAGLVVDEGQRLKNDQNQIYVALRAMKIPFRLLLTGTPLQNNKRELFNLLQFIDDSQNAARLDEEFSILDKQTLPKLHDKIRPYFLRRTKAGVLKFLPPMAQIILPVTMTTIQGKLAKSIMAKNPQLIKAMFANGKMSTKERGSLNNILMQLRKCLCHPFMYSDAIEERHHDPEVLHRNLVAASAKLLLLEIMLPKLKERGHRVLIFSQFLQQLDIIEDFLAGIGCQFRRLDGQISSLEKQRRIDAFNEPGSEIFAFLLSTRAGGVGINLATADTVIIMDPDFNPHQDMQALSRAHRIGQKHKVLCFQLVTKDSVEEQIMQIGRKKMALDHALIESMDDDDIAGDDLESILKHGAKALFDENYQKTAIHYDEASVDKLLDRSQVEQTATNDEGSGETQFALARVWANDKLGFEENQDIGEQQAPEPITSSVWDQILAQREEEARREAEANKEVLGRGARRRIAINYKTNAADSNAVFEDAVVGDISDSSDDDEFADGGASQDESDEEKPTREVSVDADFEPPSTGQGVKIGKQRGSTYVKMLAERAALEARQARQSPKAAGNGEPRRRGRPPGSTRQSTPKVPKAPPVPQAQQPAPVLRGNTGLPAGQWPVLQQQVPQAWQTAPVPVANSNLVPLPMHSGVAAGHYKRQVGVDGSQGQHTVQPSGLPNLGYPNMDQYIAPSDLQYMISLDSEAQVRLALDAIQRSPGNPFTKQAYTSILLERLQGLNMRNSPRQQAR